MKLVALAVTAAALSGTLRSDPVGIYAVIEKVEFEPREGTPERIRIWGAFSLALDRFGDQYTAPQYGAMYFSLPQAKEEVARKEWADFKSVAGTGQCVGFASRYQPKGTVRKADEKAGSADPYPTGIGLTKVRNEHPIARLVRAVPFPASPAEGAEVPAGKLTLAVRNAPETSLESVRYAFELESSQGDRESSGPVAAGEKETRWSPKMEIKPGIKYTWKAWITSANLTGSPTGGSFKGKAAP